MRLEIAVNKENTFTVPVTDNGVPKTPTQAKVSIFDKEGTTIVDTASATITAGRVAYTFPALSNNAEGRNFLARFDITLDGLVYTEQTLFDVVKYPIKCEVVDADLFGLVSRLRDEVSYTGKIEVATISTITDKNLIKQTLNFIGGALAVFQGDTPVKKTVTAYDADTGTITFSPVEATAFTAGVKFVLRANYSDKIALAFGDVQDVLRERYGYASGILDGKAIKRLVMYRALMFICIDLTQEPDDTWDKKSVKFSELYIEGLKAFNEPADTDGDGNISDTEDVETRPRQHYIGKSR